MGWAKKYARQKAAQKLKASTGTGRGPNLEQTFSDNEEAIYNLIGMKVSVEGMANKFRLDSTNGNGKSPNQYPEDFTHTRAASSIRIFLLPG